MPLISAPCGEQSFRVRLGDGGYNDTTQTVNPPGTDLVAPIAGLEQDCVYTINNGVVYLRAVFDPPASGRIRVTEAALVASTGEVIYIETFRPLWLEPGMKLEFLYQLAESGSGGVEVYPRNGANTGYAPEVSKTMGPVEIGYSGGVFALLFSTPYAARKEAGQVRLHRMTSSGWAYLQNLPTNHSTYRHISLCFDQAAQPVLAYEVPGTPPSIYIRQFDPLANDYVYRGPFTGCDPVVFNDAITLQTTEDSDVLLLYLSPDRQTLHMRAQRDQYSIEYTLETFPAPATLDIVTQLSYQWQAEGYLVNVRSDMYPVRSQDNLANIAVQPPASWQYDAIVRVRNLPSDNLDPMTISPPLAWDYIPLVVTRTLPDDTLDSMTISPPLGWDYIPTTVIRTLPDDTVGSMTISPPLGWTYTAVVVIRTLPDDSLDPMTISPPLGWTYTAVVVTRTLPDDSLDPMTISPPLNWSYDLP